VVDSREAALSEAGDIIQPINMGLITPSHIYAELGEIAAGLRLGRTAEDEITVFKSVGLAVQDAAVVKVLTSHLRTR
ncbi:MAG: ornithine cyclodeaminase family protein, partial [Nitrososphaerota archaeon]